MWHVRQQPLTINQTLSTSYAVWKEAFKTEISLLLLFCIWSVIISVLFEFILPSFWPERFVEVIGYHFTLAQIIVALFYLVGFFIIYAAIFSRLTHLNQRQPLSIKSALSVGFRKLPIFIAAIVIAMLTNCLGYADVVWHLNYKVASAVLIVFGIYLMPVFNLYYALIVIENLGPFSAYRRALQLIWGNWWRTAAVLVVPPLLSLLAMLVVYMVYAISRIYIHGGMQVDTALFLLIQTICTTLYVSGAIVVLFVQVYNLKARKGGETPD